MHSSRNAVYANNGCYSENRKKHIKTICTTITHILAIKTGSIRNNHWALKNYGNINEHSSRIFGYFWTLFTAIFQLLQYIYKVCRENQNTHFMFNNFLFFANPAVCEIMQKNNVELRRLQMTIWRMRIACWMPKISNTHSGWVIRIVFPL